MNTYVKRTIEGRRVEPSEQPLAGTVPGEANYGKYDPMRRFEPTPHCANLPVMGRTVRLETNCASLLEQMVTLFARYSGSADLPPDFLWRMFVQSDAPCTPPWPWRSTFSDEGVRFAQFGQKNFLAVDLGAREAIGFISEGLFEDAQGFCSPFVDTLFYMSAAPMGLTPFASACVASENQGLLVLGEPNHGKTTSSYLATGDGLTIHADQSVFLELVDDKLRAWGDFVPLAFRAETLQFLPELRSRTIPFAYCDFSFHYLPKPQQHSVDTSSVTPVCCVVLERGASTLPRLEHLEGADLIQCLAGHLAFKDDRSFDEKCRTVITELADLPAYRLAYGNDPAEAAPYFRQLLSRHSNSCSPDGRTVER